MNTRASVRSASDITMAVDPDAIKVIFLEALNEDGTANKLLEVLKPTLDRLTDAIQEQTIIIQSQKRDLEKKDDIINKLFKQVDTLEAKLDDIEQWGRRGSMRIQGLPESGEGPVEDKILSLVNTGLKLQPPLQLDETEVAPRLPRSLAAVEQEREQQQHQADGDNEDANPPQLPRSVIIKFVSRRVKTRVMKIPKCCKSRFPKDIFPRWPHSQKSPNGQLGQAAQKVWGHLGYMGWWFQSAC